MSCVLTINNTTTPHELECCPVVPSCTFYHCHCSFPSHNRAALTLISLSSFPRPALGFGLTWRRPDSISRSFEKHFLSLDIPSRIVSQSMVFLKLLDSLLRSFTKLAIYFRLIIAQIRKPFLYHLCIRFFRWIEKNGAGCYWTLFFIINGWRLTGCCRTLLFIIDRWNLPGCC